MILLKHESQHVIFVIERRQAPRLCSGIPLLEDATTPCFSSVTPTRSLSFAVLSYFASWNASCISCFHVFHTLILQPVSFLPIEICLGLSFLSSKKYLSNMTLLNNPIFSYTSFLPCFYPTIYSVFIY